MSMPIIIKKNHSYIAEYKTTIKNGFEHLHVRWTKSLKKAGVFNHHNDWRNRLSGFDDLKGCQLIPKWTDWERYWKSCNNFLTFVSKINNDNIKPSDVKELQKRWKIIIQKLTKSWGWNEAAANDIFDYHGTGDSIPKETDEQKLTFSKLLDTFSGELSYCSDRMNVQRILRCHGLFQHAIQRYKDEHTPVYSYRGITFSGMNVLVPLNDDIGCQRLLCNVCSKKYTGNDLVKIKDSYWGSTSCCICEKRKSAYFMRFLVPKEIEKIK